MKEQEVKGSLQAGSAIKEEASFLFTELVDYLITDVATEAHRAARLGFDYRLDVEEEEDARSSDKERDDAGEAGFSGAGADSGGSKSAVDVFGQTHPSIASDAFDCMNCGRSIVAGRFAPHLEKCMGKVFQTGNGGYGKAKGMGRRARLKTVKNNIQVPQQKRSRSSPSSSHGTALVPLGSIGNRSYNKLQMQKEAQRVGELNDETSDEGQEDEDKVRRARLQGGQCQVSA